MHATNALCFLALLLGSVLVSSAHLCDEQPLHFASFHIHVLFWQADANHTAGALKLREAFTEQFALEGKRCAMSAGDPVISRAPAS